MLGEGEELVFVVFPVVTTYLLRGYDGKNKLLPQTRHEKFPEICEVHSQIKAFLLI